MIEILGTVFLTLVMTFMCLLLLAAIGGIIIGAIALISDIRRHGL